jgi:hypothetical protein
VTFVINVTAFLTNPFLDNHFTQVALDLVRSLVPSPERSPIFAAIDRTLVGTMQSFRCEIISVLTPLI